jgi:xanthine dehydrogenase molybdenum-binding subunit
MRLRVGSTTNTGRYSESVGLMECVENVRAEMVKQAALCGLQPDALFLPHTTGDAAHLIHAWGFAVGYKNTGLGGGAPDKAGAESSYTTMAPEVRASAELGRAAAVMQMRLPKNSVPSEHVRYSRT